MDPITHGLLGAAIAQAALKRRLPRSAWLLGAVAAMAPDLDICIRPLSDPLGGLTYHRHFTHSLAFIPAGGLIVALPFLLLPIFRGRRCAVLAATTLAYATHSLLDACTSYGTVLFWPFSMHRVALDYIAIIDPVFTLALLVGVVVTAITGRARAVRVALVVAGLYMALGAVQHGRVAAAQRQLAATRGDVITHARSMPTLANLVVWRSIYVAGGKLHADSVRMPLPGMGAATVRVGADVPQVTEATLAVAGYNDPDLLAAFARFAWFADGFTAWDESNRRVVGDMRYCMQPDHFASLWGVLMPPKRGDPFDMNRITGGATNLRLVGLPGPRDQRLTALWTALIGRDPAFQTLASLVNQTPK